MKKLMAGLFLLAITATAQATIITFEGVVTTVELSGNIDYPAAAVGETIFGELDLPDEPDGFWASLSLGIGSSDPSYHFKKVQGGYEYESDIIGSQLGFDSGFGFAVGLRGGGGWYATGTNDIGDEQFRQSYSGYITSVTVTPALPDTGSTVGLLAIGLVALLAPSYFRRKVGSPNVYKVARSN